MVLTGSNGRHRFESDVVLSAHEARRATLNGEPLRSAEQLRHELRSLVFTPDRLAIVKGGPATRRAYFDRSLGRLFPARASLPVEYAAALGQRNAALRRLSAGFSSRAAVDPWTETVVSLGRSLVESRAATLDALSVPFTACAEHLGLHRATLDYAGEPPSEAELEARFEKDLERGVTGAGPHLHDVVVRAGDRELRSFGSQGEQRVAVLALVLAEAEALAGEGGLRPLVLLDDVLSELDEDRRRALADLIADVGQTVVTSTSAGVLPTAPSQLLAVMPGTVRAV